MRQPGLGVNLKQMIKQSSSASVIDWSNYVLSTRRNGKKTSAAPGMLG